VPDDAASDHAGILAPVHRGHNPHEELHARRRRYSLSRTGSSEPSRTAFSKVMVAPEPSSSRVATWLSKKSSSCVRRQVRSSLPTPARPPSRRAEPRTRGRCPAPGPSRGPGRSGGPRRGTWGWSSQGPRPRRARPSRPRRWPRRRQRSAAGVRAGDQAPAPPIPTPFPSPTRALLPVSGRKHTPARRPPPI